MSFSNNSIAFCVICSFTVFFIKFLLISSIAKSFIGVLEYNFIINILFLHLKNKNANKQKYVTAKKYHKKLTNLITSVEINPPYTVIKGLYKNSKRIIPPKYFLDMILLKNLTFFFTKNSAIFIPKY